MNLARLAFALALCACSAGAAAQAPPWPERSVRVIVPSPGGSGIDLVARMLAQRLALHWGKPVIVENRPGANSIVGAEAVARSAPDGYTLLFCSDATLTANPHLYPKLPYDPVADFAPIAQVATFTQLLVAHPSVGASDLAGLVATAKANPGRITYASPGTGSIAHLMTELLMRKTGIDLLHVPYKGFAPAFGAVTSGEAGLTWAGVFSARGHVQAGRLRAIGVASLQRSRMMPEVPTFAELGVAELDVTLWFGLLAPVATPPAVVEHIHRAIAQLIAEPEVRDGELLARGYEPSGLAPAQFAALIRRELSARGGMARAAGLKDAQAR